MKIDIKKAFKSVTEAVEGIVAVAFAATLGVILVGTLIFAVTGGQINLPTAFNAVLNGFDATMSAWFSSTIAIVATIVALVVVVVLVVLFGYKKYMGGKGKGDY